MQSLRHLLQWKQLNLAGIQTDSGVQYGTLRNAFPKKAHNYKKKYVTIKKYYITIKIFIINT